MSTLSTATTNYAERNTLLQHFYTSLEGGITAETLSLGFEAMCVLSSPLVRKEKALHEESKEAQSSLVKAEKELSTMQNSADPFLEKANERGISSQEQLQHECKLINQIAALKTILKKTHQKATLGDQEYNNLSRRLVLEAITHSTQYIKRTTVLLHSCLGLLPALNLTQLALKPVELELLPTLTPRLQVLHCSNIDDIGLATIAKITSLKVLKITHSGKMSDQGVSALSALIHLTSLSIEGTHHRLGNKAILTLTRLPKLQEIEIPTCSVTDKGADFLLQMPQLTRVILRDSLIRKSTKERIIQEHPFLERFDGFKQKKPTDSEFSQLLDVSQIQNPQGFMQGSCQRLTDVSLKVLVEKRPQLEEITLHGCHLFTDASLLHIATIKNLRTVSMYGCKLITWQGVLKAFPKERGIVFDIQKGISKISQIKRELLPA